VVAHELAAWIVTVHMIVALVIVQLLLYATVSARPRGAGTTGTPRTPITRATLCLILVTMIQIVIGTQVRGAVDVALDGGVPRADAVASVGMLDHLHRGAALPVFAGSLMIVLWLGSRVPGERTLIRWAYMVAALATAQVGLGVVMTYVSLLPAAQVGHLVIASLLLGAETVLLLVGQDRTRGGSVPA
jgi:cytochrome c oxidase assembly protein subunit 15